VEAAVVPTKKKLIPGEAPPEPLDWSWQMDLEIIVSLKEGHSTVETNVEPIEKKLVPGGAPEPLE
jgi:hypothetical protein